MSQLADNQKVSFLFVPEDSLGNPVTIVAGSEVTVTSSDTASVSVVLDATPAAGSVASGFLVAGSKLQDGVTITGRYTPPGQITITAVQTIDVIAAVASQAEIKLGTPVSQ